VEGDVKPWKQVGWILIGVCIGALTASFVGSAKAQQPAGAGEYKVIQTTRDAVALQALLNSEATRGWRLRAMDGGVVVLER
jgi:uncharacterized oligopeptide transporter (OPT) family protein